MTMTMIDAVRQVTQGVIPGMRGAGCAVIHMADGRRYHLVDDRLTLVERYDNNATIVERVEAAEVEGDVDRVRWSVDQLGGAYC